MFCYNAFIVSNTLGNVLSIVKMHAFYCKPINIFTLGNIPSVKLSAEHAFITRIYPHFPANQEKEYNNLCPIFS